jgi:iron complex transport system substrate-binding protein
VRFNFHVWIFTLPLLVAMAACARPAPAAAPHADANRLIVHDGTGRTVVLASNPQRIVSISPAATDILEISLGIHAEIVGVTRYCQIPAADEKHVTRVGGVLDPNYEGILALKPDLVVVPWLADHTLQDKLISMGLSVVIMHPEGLEGVVEDIRMIGQATGHAAAGESAAQQIENIRALTAKRWQSVPANQRPHVLIRMGDDSPAPGSYVDDLITAAGGQNILPHGPRAWETLGPEAILQLAPDLIIDIPSPDDSSTAANPGSTPLLGSTKIVTINDSAAFYHPGPEVGRGIWDLARVIYPQFFPEPTPPTTGTAGAP